MTWILVLLLAAACLAIAVWWLRVPRAMWMALAAALAFGLAGYALQANPGMSSAPARGAFDAGGEQQDVVAQRQEFIGDEDRSTANLIITADAMARRSRYADAATYLAGVTEQNPADFEAWLALGIALTEHADGALTAPALYAFRQAAALKPAHPGPGYFLGVSLIRQGQLLEARQAWAETLANAPPDAAGRAGLAERLARLDGLLAQIAAGAPAQPPAQPPAQSPIPPPPPGNTDQ
ncbi:tetratricopeptide repeat protein [Aurantiacibacter luteus]|uniref:Uncharacterized protein n=1 Tax=Aurantiacibacter luteus TaxID=1581420 RepID=A0A0G9MX54_9SPHN|nr:hypothetical protein [Aurantiacibacter luteus]KLE35316.1 hypothetical protein AAW00_02375 [Aurantiacibacter luteus]